MLYSLDFCPDARGWDRMVAGHDGEVIEHNQFLTVHRACYTAGNLVEVTISYPLSFCRDKFDPLYNLIQLVICRVHVCIGQHLPDCMSSHMLTECKPPPVAYHFGRHNARFKGRGTRNHPVGVDTTLMRECIFTDHRLGRWDTKPPVAGDKPGCFDQFFQFNTRTNTVNRFKDHGRLREICITRTFTEAVHGNLYLGRPGLYGSNGIPHSKAEIVVAMHINRAGNLGRNFPDKDFHCRGGDYPDGIGDVNHRCSRLCRYLEHLHKVVPVRPCRIHCREHAQVTVVPDITHDLSCNIQHFFSTFMDRVGTLDFGSRDKDVDHVHITIQADVHVLFFRPCKPADPRVESQVCNSLHGLPLGF